MKTFPTDAKVVFLLCEDFRAELGGKASLLGAFLGGDIVIQEKKVKGLALPSLAFIFMFNDGSGSFDSKFEILSPDDKPIIPDSGTTSAIKKPDASMNIISKVAPFPAEEGTYKVHVQLDDKLYKREFKIRYQEQG
ncbi:MAG: hypothetical protein PHG89_04660 [Gallionella sp.]|nr:hypothetical protein [Gallionella sp.]